jgi:putative tryptophan/tyrosine transport system substrate-binding protein
MKKIIFFTLLIGFIGCISDNKKTKVKTIAVVNLMAHPILDDVQKGLLDELAKAGYADNDSTRIIIKNASGQTNLIPSIINDVKLANPDLVIAITTPVAQEFKGKVKCPIVFAAVTDPVGAGLVNDLNVAEENITGSSDRTDIEANIRLIRQIHPKATRLGLLFNPAEAASQYGLRETQKYAPKYGFTLVEGVVNSTAEMYPVVNSIINKVDVMFISTDNTVAAAIPAAIRLSFDKKIPLYAFDDLRSH